MNLKKNEVVITTEPHRCGACGEEMYRESYPVSYEMYDSFGTAMVIFYPKCFKNGCDGYNALVHNTVTNTVDLVCKKCGARTGDGDRMHWARVAPPNEGA